MLFTLGCQQEEIQQESSGIVEATQAYEKSFGLPPQGKAGRAYAAVGYLPVKDKPDTFGPLPIFLFAEESQQEKVLSKLVSGDLVTSQNWIYYNPFPNDLEVTFNSKENGSLTIDLLTKEDWESNDLHAGAIAIIETSLQFNDVQSVKVLLNGVAVPGTSESGFQMNRDLIIEVPPPTLILMAGAWEKGEETPEEILVEFDRPVKVEEFKLYHIDGTEVQGEYYKSMFQMAVVIHPKSPNLFRESTSLRAEWSVVDELGRANSGIDTMQLIRYEH